MAVAYGEQKRRREAMDQLVGEIARAEHEGDSIKHLQRAYGSAVITNHIRTAIERGWLDNFSQSLSDLKKRKEVEIDRICSRHYSDFLNSIHEMIQMRSSASHITELVNIVNKQFSATGGDLVEVLKDLNNIQTERDNARKLLEATLHCKELAALMVKTRQQIESDDHYNAMRTIEIIQAEINNISVKSMAQFLEKWLPIAKNKLLYAAKTEADSYLSQKRKSIELIGQTILRNQAQITASANISMSSTTTSKIPPTTVNASNKFSNDKLGETTSDIRNSISLKFIRTNGKVFNLHKWSNLNDFDALSSVHFYSNPSVEGFEIIENLLEDIGPLHKVLHLYAILGNLNSYHDHYRSQRESVLNKIMEQAERSANSTSQRLSLVIPKYIDNLIGFFMIECMHKRCVEIAEGAFSTSEISHLWDRACVHIDKLCTNLSITASSPEELINIKEELLLLIDTVSDDAFGFKVNIINDTMKNLWEIFEGLQVDAVMRSCSNSLDKSAYQPYYVDSDEVFKKYIRAYRLDTIELNEEINNNSNNKNKNNSNISSISKSLKSTKNGLLEKEKTSIFQSDAAANLDLLEEEMSFSSSSANFKNDSFEENSPQKSVNRRQSISQTFLAQTFPFSEAIPDLMHALHLFIVRFFVFAVKNPHLGSRGEEICNAIVEAYKSICKLLYTALTKNGIDTPLSKACQISIDSATLSAASDCVWLLVESALVKFRWTEKIDIYIANAMKETKSHLLTLVTQSQDLIFELLSKKIKDLLSSLVFINFEPDIMPTSAHDCIEEIIDFLKVTFMLLTHLPQSIREAVHFTCCSRVANGIMQFILSSKVQAINVLCILAFDYDVNRLVQFADSCGITHLKQCFEEISGLIKSILHPDLPQLADNVGLRKKLFPNVNLAKLAILLDKMSPSSIVACSNNLPRMEKQLTKNLAKKFRSQLTSV